MYEENLKEIIGLICEYRIRNYMKLTSVSELAKTTDAMLLK
jgi:hypothetical protein